MAHCFSYPAFCACQGHIERGKALLDRKRLCEDGVPPPTACIVALAFTHADMLHMLNKISTSNVAPHPLHPRTVAYLPIRTPYIG